MKDKGRFVIEQCTGLRDKNGKLIYEGDVVTFYPAENDTHKCRVVVWEDYSWATLKIGKTWSFGKHEIEIVGNIHEEKWRIDRRNEEDE